MIETEATLRRWGRSLGIVIPHEAVQEAGMHENEHVEVIIRKRKNPLAETFGKYTFKKSTAQMLKESDAECWDE